MERNIYSYVPNYAVIKSIPRDATTILDIGCGNGGLADFISCKIDGITISEIEYNLAKQKLNKVFLYNLENGLPDKLEKYDVIIASHVLEHIAYPEKLLLDVKKVMHKNSIFIVALPNFVHYKYRIKICFGNFNYENSGVMDYTHLRWYTFKSALQLLQNNDLYVINSFADGKLPFYRVTKKIPEIFQKLIKKVLFFISKGLFGAQFILIARNKNLKFNN